jgi:hypothetical protein
MHSKKVRQPKINVCVVCAHHGFKESNDLLQNTKCKV